MAKETEFLEQNRDLILMNLLQAEQHLVPADYFFRKGQTLEPEVGACILKHLLIAEGEAAEAVQHCRIANPQECAFWAEVKNDIYSLRKDFERHGFDISSLEKVRNLRKKVEKFVRGYDTSQCELCSNVEQYLKQKIKEKEEKTMSKVNLQHDVDTAYYLVTAMIEGKVSEARIKLSELSHEKLVDIAIILLEKLSKISDAIKAIPQEATLHKLIELEPTKDTIYTLFSYLTEVVSKVEDILLDPISKQTIALMKEKGCDIKAHPICVLAKRAKGESLEQATKECIDEGKVHWISLYKCKLM